MIRIDVYQHGAGFKVRAHHHAADMDGACNDDCEEYSVQRCYPERYASPRDVREMLAIMSASSLREKGIGHVEFLTHCGYEDALLGF
uniref:Uncharacterized protein n=1 Tax=uncultured prokaryote TaxID=198431 RepID=A0A0H5Q495_9ZZZZ|nr:hypothetical protein [uncultured prokaryote]